MPKRICLIDAALPLVTAVLLLITFVMIGSTSFYWPLAAGALVASVIAMRAGFTVPELALAARDGMKSTLIALSILVVVGALIGVWKASGTVPALVYYGLGLANPRFLVPAAFLLALSVSMMLGTSIGTLSTIGVAVMGVAQGVGAPIPLVAGALVSGALFGDRSSPLSGSLNLNVAMTGTDLRQMLSRLAPTGIAAAAVSLLIYLVLGLGQPTVDARAGGSELQGALAAHFVISSWLLLPPVLVLALAFLRVPVRWALGVGIATGAGLAVLVGGVDIEAPIAAAVFGFTAQTGDPALDRIFSGGGVVPMAKQVALLLVAGAFNGIMEATGMMSLVIARLVEGIRRPAALVGTTMAISVAVALMAANQALAIIVPGRMLRPAYARMGLSAERLSCALADSGTVLSGVVPWNLMGLLAAAALGIPVRVFAPYAVLVLVLPAISLGAALLAERRADHQMAFDMVKGD